MRGKILNVERARFDKMLGSQEIGTLITALGTGIGREEFNPDKLRYHRIIIMTDADVDGSHIRTLLLTFFFRQMPELIERGHLYIAQPPLYKATRGKQALYLKDERALEDFLIDSAASTTRSCASNPASNSRANSSRASSTRPASSGRSCRACTRATTVARSSRRRLRARCVPMWSTTRSAGPRRPPISPQRLDAISEELERGWAGEVRDGGYVFCAHGARREAGLGARSGAHREPGGQEARRACQVPAGRLCEARRPSCARATRCRSTGRCRCSTPCWPRGRKGLQLQRYKGLGEMTAQQLWETTLDRDVRSLLQVKVKDVTDADDLFVKLMGDVVEPRREFIQDNALSVANLDV